MALFDKEEHHARHAMTGAVTDVFHRRNKVTPGKPALRPTENAHGHQEVVQTAPHGEVLAAMRRTPLAPDVFKRLGRCLKALLDHAQKGAFSE